MTDPTQVKEVSELEALAKALELAPGFLRRTHVSQAVNRELGLDWSEACWRGIWKKHAGDAFLVNKRLGTGRSKHPRVLKIGGNLRGVGLFDAHAPFQDDDAIALVCRVIRWWQPDVGIFGGDEIDFYGLSKYDKNPGRKFTVQDEVDAAQSRVLVPVRAAMPKDSRLYKVEGNHCHRLERHLWANPELFSLTTLSLPVLLELDKIGIEYVPYAVEFSDLLHVSHGTKVSINAGYAAKAELVKRFYRISTLTGHNHRNGKHQGNYRGQPVVGQEVACLCHTEPEYQDDPNWSKGLALWEIRDGDLWITHVDIYDDYTCCVGGKWFGL